MDVTTSPQHLAVGEVEQISLKDPIHGRSYASIFSGQKHAERTQNLDLCPVTTEQGVPTVEFTVDEVNAFTREEGLHQAVILKFSYGKPELQELRRILPLLFDVKSKCNIGQLEYRHILVRLDLFEDFANVVSKTSGYIKSKGEEFFFRTFPWTMDFNPREETSKAVTWISFPELPANFFAKKSLLSIASVVGKPISIDKANQDRTRPSTARVKILINLTDRHPKKVKLKIIDKKSGRIVEYDQRIVFDNLPKYCTCCNHQGHDVSSCRWKAVELSDQGGYVVDPESYVSLDKLKGDAREYLNANIARRRTEETKLIQATVSDMPDAVVHNSNAILFCNDSANEPVKSHMNSLVENQSNKDQLKLVHSGESLVQEGLKECSDQENASQQHHLIHINQKTVNVVDSLTTAVTENGNALQQEKDKNSVVMARDEVVKAHNEVSNLHNAGTSQTPTEKFNFVAKSGQLIDIQGQQQECNIEATQHLSNTTEQILDYEGKHLNSKVAPKNNSADRKQSHSHSKVVSDHSSKQTYEKEKRAVLAMTASKALDRIGKLESNVTVQVPCEIAGSKELFGQKFSTEHHRVVNNDDHIVQAFNLVKENSDQHHRSQNVVISHASVVAQVAAPVNTSDELKDLDGMLGKENSGPSNESPHSDSSQKVRSSLGQSTPMSDAMEFPDSINNNSKGSLHNTTVQEKDSKLHRNETCFPPDSTNTKRNTEELIKQQIYNKSKLSSQATLNKPNAVMYQDVSRQSDLQARDINLIEAIASVVSHSHVGKDGDNDSEGEDTVVQVKKKSQRKSVTLMCSANSKQSANSVRNSISNDTVSHPMISTSSVEITVENKIATPMPTATKTQIRRPPMRNAKRKEVAQLTDAKLNQLSNLI